LPSKSALNPADKGNWKRKLQKQCPNRAQADKVGGYKGCPNRRKDLSLFLVQLAKGVIETGQGVWRILSERKVFVRRFMGP